MSNGLIDELKRALLALDKGAMLHAVGEVGEGTAGVSVDEAVEAIADGLRVAGKRFQAGEWFVGELVYAADVAQAAMEVLTPMMPVSAAGDSLGTVVVGTVAGDLHDLGKNIFVNYAKAAGFDVVDLGVDVSKDRFAAAVKERAPIALGLSCLVTVTALQIGEVIAELHTQGLREGTRVIVGGAALTEEFASGVGADAFAADAVTGTDIIRKWGRA